MCLELTWFFPVSFIYFLFSSSSFLPCLASTVWWPQNQQQTLTDSMNLPFKLLFGRPSFIFILFFTFLVVFPSSSSVLAPAPPLVAAQLITQSQAAVLKTSNSVSYHSTQYSITHQISLLNLHKYSTSFDLLTTTAFATIESNSTITVIGLSTGRVGNRGVVWERKESERLSIFVAK